MNIRRAMASTLMQVVITLVVTTILVTIYIAVLSVQNQGALPDAWLVGERAGRPIGMAVGVIAAFLAGWWGARGIADRTIGLGVLIGAMVGTLSLVMDAITGNLGVLTAVIVTLEIAAAVAGAMLAKSRASPAAAT